MTDAAFRAWIQTLPSCLSGRPGDWVEYLGEFRCEAAHVRRAGFSGTAYKAEYATVPLLHAEHHEQTVHGELTCVLKFSRDRELKRNLLDASPDDAEKMAAEWFDAQVIRYLKMWEKQQQRVLA